jgi:dipeptidyl aminopeptidase/acylaminoacyl peptidase
MMEGENGDRPEHFTVNWSPDSKKIQTQIVDLRLAEKMYLLDFTEEEKFRPKLLSYYRGSPGDTTIVKYIPVLFDVASKSEQRIQLPPAPHFMGFDLNWEKDSKSLSGTYTHRGYKKLEVISVDADSGKVNSIWADSSQTSLESNGSMQKLNKNHFLINSPKSGWNHLYLVDWESGAQSNPITSGEYKVSKVHKVGDNEDWIYFEANGKEKGRNVYYTHLYKVKPDGTDLELLTPENAFHEVHLSPDKKYVVDNFSKVDQPTKSIVRELESGKLVMEISEADISNLEKRGYRSPQNFYAVANDGKTEIYGIYYLPTDFDEKKSYPVIDYTYSGPFIAITPKTFKAGLIGLQQPMAEFGFVVVTVDGMGTAERSNAFRDVSYRNLGDGTTDHVLAIKSLAAEHDFIDIERVGIFGHSAGGYDAARAMLLHPDFYKVGVASAGDHDHRMEKAWWPEMYMGYPVGDYYHEQSNITNAANLRGRLLLAHGAKDENVNPSATYKFVDALIKAGKEFDMFILPSNNHSFGRTNGDYFTKKRWDYFIRHLLGEEPLFNYQIGD